MKVDKSQFQENQRHLRKLVSGQRNEIAAREQEIENLRSYYDGKVDNERVLGEKKLLGFQDRSKAQLMEASTHQEEKLMEIKQNLDDTEVRLQKQRENLIVEHQNQIKDLNTQHSLKSRDLFDKANVELQDINFDVNNKIKRTKIDTERTIQQSKNKSNLQLNESAYATKARMASAQNSQAGQLRKAQEQYMTALKKDKAEHKTKLAEATFKNELDYKTRERIFADKKDALDKHYQERLLSEKKAFEQKYSAAVKQHQEILTRLEEKLNKEVTNSIEASAKKKNFVEVRADDEFYSLEKLNPRMREDAKNYFLDIPAPEHEKDNYVVTTHKRKIKVSFSRNAEKRLDGDNGEVDTTMRSESMTKEFKVPEIMDDKNVKVSYKDGILSYKIPKA